jgi:signal transduction histidine kinase
MQLRRQDIIFYAVIAYVLLAGGWWSYLLYIKNEDAQNSKKELFWYVMKEQGFEDKQAYIESATYTKLEDRYTRQKWMIMGEGFVLLLFTIFGIWKVAKSRQQEILLAEQQRNFLLSITHELKSPIAAIKLILQTFERKKLTEKQADLLTSNALKDTERLHKLVNDLLLAARVDGGYQYSFEEVDLVEIVANCIQLAKPKFKGEIILETNEEFLFLAHGDHSTLTSIVTNIIGNAVKYAKKTPFIKIRLNTNKDNAVLEVIDTGIGISKSEKERVFEKFYRVGSEETRLTKGTGLGLYIVKEVVTAHKGTVKIKDNNPQGTIFCVTLPIK